MKYSNARFAAAAMAAALAFLPVAEASARGGFRGGGFRSSPVRSFSAPRSLGAPRAARSWGSATRPKAAASDSTPGLAAPSLFSSRRSISGSRSSVSQQRGLYDSARRNGTLFSSQTEATQAFRSRYAKDYGSTFAAEPTARPSYIPQSTMVGGRNVNIFYNQGLGGYGYLHPTLGTWMLYDAISDAAMANSLMGSRGYYYGGAPVYLSHGPSFLGLAFAVLVLLIVAAAIAGIVSKRASARWQAAREEGRNEWRKAQDWRSGNS
jgi:hypothetical protein